MKTGKENSRQVKCHRPIPVWRKAFYGLATTMLVFLLLEGALAVIGVRPHLDTRDPYLGFASNVPLFVDDSDDNGQAILRTAQNKLEYFNAQQFPRDKPAGTVRIFCMGGSTTFGRPYDDTTSFAAWLREMLPLSAPSSKWEVINAGGVSYASYRVAVVMEQLVDYQPDLFIIYTGHNEFLEERTYGELREVSPMGKWITTVKSRSRFFSLMHGLLGPDHQIDAAQTQLAGEVDAVLDHTVGPASYQRDDVLRQRILEHYQWNLHKMVDLARSVGAKVVFIKPASNIKDSSPFKSQHAEGLSAIALEQWDENYQRGRSLAGRGQMAAALTAFEQASRIDNRYARLHFDKGKALLELGRSDDALQAFELAMEEDVCPLRALPIMGDILEKVGRQKHVAVIDFNRVLTVRCQETQGHNCLGREFFLDHVHPTIDATRLLAQTIVERLLSDGIIDGGSSLSDQQLAHITSVIESRIDDQVQARSLLNLAKVLNWAGKHEEAGPLALRALKALPDDPQCLLLAAAYLNSIGKIEQAVEYGKKATKLAPKYAEAHQFISGVLIDQKEYEEAHKHLEQLLSLATDDPQAYQMIGAVCVQLGWYDEAVAHFLAAEKLNPKEPHLHYNLAYALALRGDLAEAMRNYHQAIVLDSNDADAHYNLALLYVNEQQMAQAVTHYRRALEIRPGFSDARANLQKALIETTGDR